MTKLNQLIVIYIGGVWQEDRHGQTPSYIVTSYIFGKVLHIDQDIDVDLFLKNFFFLIN